MTDSADHSGATRRLLRDCAGRRLALVMAASVVTLVAGRADVTAPAGIGPVGQNMALEVLRGGEVEVRLFASAKGVSVPLEYSIFEAPRHGILSPIRVREGVQGAFVTYRFPSQSPAVADSFKFRARIPGGRYSSAITVGIRVQEPRPMLDLPPSLEFGRVPMRGEAVLELPILNRGTGAFNAEVRLPEPFRLRGGGAFVNIPPGGETVIEIGFAPRGEVGKSEYVWNLQPESPRGRTVLRGQSFAPFQVDRPRAKLDLGDDLVRRTEIRVENPGGDPMAIQVTAPERLKIEPSVFLLDGGAAKSLQLSLPASDVASFSGEVELRVPYHVTRIGVRADACPARVVVVSPEEGGLRFDGEYGEPIARELRLRNAGGETAFVSATVNPPYRIVEGKSGIPLEPGAEMTYHLELHPTQIGRISELLKIEGAGMPIELPLDAQITLAPGSPPPPAPPTTPGGDKDPPATAREEGSIPTKFLVEGMPEVVRKTDQSIPRVTGVRLAKQGKDSLTLAWNHPGDGDWDYVVETEVHRIDPETQLPFPLWIELTSANVSIISDAQGGRAEVKGLKPGGRYTFRVLTRGEGDRFSRPGGRVYVSTTFGQNAFAWVRPWMLVVLALLGIGIAALYRRRAYLRELYG